MNLTFRKKAAREAFRPLENVVLAICIPHHSAIPHKDTSFFFNDIPFEPLDTAVGYIGARSYSYPPLASLNRTDPRGGMQGY
jgi:hypothetical protein